MLTQFDRLPHKGLLTAVCVVAILLLGFCLQTSLQITDGVLGAPLDDAWIHFQFARNISQGYGFSFNPGEPTPGSTAPLWTVLLAVVGLFTDDFMIPALLLSSLFFLLTVGLTYGFAFSVSQHKGAALLAAVGVALSGRLLWAGLAAMETTAFAALSVAAVWRMKQQGGLRPLPALLFGLASQVRPEGHALFAFAGVLHLWQWGLKEGIRSGVLPVLLYGITAAPYALFSLATTGQPLPNTFYAKVGEDSFFSWRALQETIRLHWYDNPTSLLLAVVGLRPLWRQSRLAVVWLVGLFLLTPVVVDFVWHHGRYTMPLIPFQMVAAAMGAVWLWQRLEVKRSLMEMRLFVLILSFLFVWGGSWQLGAWAQMLGTNTQEILDIDVALGMWLAENTPPDALIAVDDIGAITFLSERRIIDLNGLVSPEMWPAVRQPIGLPRNQVAARILSQLQPDYMVGFALWHWELATTPEVAEPIFTVRTPTHTMIAEPEATVYRMTWPYVDAPLPQVAQDVLLGDVIRLIGYDWQQVGAQLEMALYWQSETAVGQDYDVFVHVLDDVGQIVAQSDQQPLRGLAATSLWQPADIVRDVHRIELPAGGVIADYEVQVGIYWRESGQRLTVADSVNDVVVLGDLGK